MPETKELQVRKSCQLGGEEEMQSGGREGEREREGWGAFFSPLAESCFSRISLL